MKAAVPFLDLRAGYQELAAELDEAVLRVNRSGWYLLGEEIRGFEEEWADYLGVSHCVGVGNGLEALRLSLLAMDVGPGDEVIVPSFTFIATWLAVTETGATPVPVECDERTYNIDPERVRAAITSRTRAIIPVHLFGQPADLGPILEVAAQHGIRCLEDAAQAHGARYRGVRIGGMSDAAAWSMYPGKNLGAFGDAGAVTTNDAGIADKLRRLRNYGATVKYQHDIAGVNSRLDEMQAAVLRVKLRHLDSWNARRAEQAATYTRELANTSLILPFVPEGIDPVWHLYVVRCTQRDDLRASLAAAGVDALIHYPVAPHMQGAYRSLGFEPGDLPGARTIADQVLSLPIGPHLTRDQQQLVISAVQEFANLQSDSVSSRR